MQSTNIKINSGPAAEPVSSTECKTQARIDSSTYDTLIGTLITAARQTVEKHIRRTCINTTYALYFDAFPDDDTEPLELIYAPVSSITSVKYYNTSNTQTTWSATEYLSDLVSVAPRITPAYGYSWPSTIERTNAVEVIYVAGYGASGSGYVPEPIRQAIIMLVCDMFEHPEAQVEQTLAQNKTLGFLLSAYKLPAL
jgi:uncharacterized phiE125 gp8 family phage protein